MPDRKSCSPRRLLASPAAACFLAARSSARPAGLADRLRFLPPDASGGPRGDVGTGVELAAEGLAGAGEARAEGGAGEAEAVALALAGYEERADGAGGGEGAGERREDVGLG